MTMIRKEHLAHALYKNIAVGLYAAMWFKHILDKSQDEHWNCTRKREKKIKLIKVGTNVY